MKLIGSRVFFDQLWQQTCENQILCIVQQIGPELILQFVRLYGVFFSTVVKHHQSEII